MKVLVTGAAGFIGSHFVRLLLDRPDMEVVSLDALTYAGNLANLSDLEGHPRHRFVKGSIDDTRFVDQAVHAVDAVVNFAAESHVDRSLAGPRAFVATNVQGTLTLLEAVKRYQKRFLQVSTDEVYGSLPGSTGAFTEEAPLRPANPYAATKAAADHLALAYAHSFGLDVAITRSTNNYGPRQYPEKLVPLFVSRALADQPCPVYGDGCQVRDWLHVTDNCRGILAALERGRRGHVYNLGGGCERTNLEVAHLILRYAGKPETLIQHVTDRPGHDRRYAVDSTKALRELAWRPEVPFETGLRETVEWYAANQSWIAALATRP